jgi:hypothetical protein
MTQKCLKVMIHFLSLIIVNTEIATVTEHSYPPQPVQLKPPRKTRLKSRGGKKDEMIIDLVSPDPSPESKTKVEPGAAGNSPTARREVGDEHTEPPGKKDELIIDLVSPDPSLENRSKVKLGATRKSRSISGKVRNELVEAPGTEINAIIDLVSPDPSPESKTKVSSRAAGKSPTVRAKVRDGLVELAIGDGQAAEAFGGAVLGDTERSAIIEILSSSAGSKKSSGNAPESEPEPEVIPGLLNWEYEYRVGLIGGNRAIQDIWSRCAARQ